MKRSRVSAHPPAPPADVGEAELQRWHHEQYFSAYADTAVHVEMLRDRERTLAYQKALERHCDGKVVLDVGCGTGVLSIFAARAGAKKVYAVEASALAEQTRAIVAANGLSAVITVLQCRAEDLELPEQVDVLVSEWMGYALFYENMLPSVLCARDRWLRPGGLMLPSHATLWAAPHSDEPRFREATEFWDDVYGIDMSALAPLALRSAFAEPLVECVPPESLITWPIPLRRIDCGTVAAADVLPWTSGRFTAACLGSGLCTGLTLWFDVEFESVAAAAAEAAAGIVNGGLVLGKGVAQKRHASEEEVIVLSTGPEDPATHWMSVSLFLDQPLRVTQDSVVSGSVCIDRHASNERFLALRLSMEAASPGQAPSEPSVKTFDML